MKTKFSKFILTEGSDYGIAHLEDLDVEKFILAIEKLHKLEAVQKLDGANLRGGLDEKGRVYSSREQKGGKRFYAQKDFPKNSAYDGFRAAHEVLIKMTPILESVLAPGEAFNMEVIYGDQPNTVFYGLDGFNYLAILEMLPGDDPSSEPNQQKVSQIVEAAKGKRYVVKSERSETTDGENLIRTPVVTDWKIVKSDHVPKDKLKEFDFGETIQALKKFLDKDNPAADKLGKSLSNFEVLKDKSQKLADERKSLEDRIMSDYKLPIKDELLKLVNDQSPSLRGNVEEKGAYNGIEGIIFTDPKTREKFKVVDREVFTKINKFNYQARNAIASKILTNDPNAPLESKGGIVGDARLRSIQLFGIGNADVSSQTKKVLANFKGSSRDETIKNIADSVHQLSFEAAKRKIEAIYINALDDLADYLDSFKKSADEYELKLESGKTIKYTPEIKRRTLMTFAEARKQLLYTLSQVKKCSYIEDLIEVFFSSQLDALHMGEESITEDDAGISSNAIVAGDDTALGNIASSDSPNVQGLYRLNKMSTNQVTKGKYMFRDNKVIKKKSKKFKVIKFKAPESFKPTSAGEKND